MRQFVSPGVGKSTIRLCVAVLLAGAATGCSSDASRFDGLFSRSDNITTNSIPRDATPVPRGDVAVGQMAAASPADNGALGQPYPTASAQGGYDPVNTASTPVSAARGASTPISVQRTTLADPSATTRQRPEAQPFPAARQQAAIATQQTLPAAVNETASKSGWTTQNAPTIMVRPGDNVAVLSKRFGVPEKEILKANGLQSAAQVETGQRLVIPTFGSVGSPAKGAATNSIAGLDGSKRQPSPLPNDQRDVAILPGSAQSRDKNAGKTDVVAGKPATNGEGSGGGTYTVKPGDSLNRIAKTTGVSVAALKQANGLSAESIRVGQTLQLPGGGGGPRRTRSKPHRFRARRLSSRRLPHSKKVSRQNTSRRPPSRALRTLLRSRRMSMRTRRSRPGSANIAGLFAAQWSPATAPTSTATATTASTSRCLRARRSRRRRTASSSTRAAA